MSTLLRLLRHLWTAIWPVRAAMTPAVRAAIEAEIAATESRHAGEIRFAIEQALGLPQLCRGVTARQRALQLFAGLGVWDTEQNNGVLIYVLLADHCVELVADRGIAARVPIEEWRQLCGEVEARYRSADYIGGSQVAVRGVARCLARHFPHAGADRDELPNQPVLL